MQEKINEFNTFEKKVNNNSLDYGFLSIFINFFMFGFIENEISNRVYKHLNLIILIKSMIRNQN